MQTTFITVRSLTKYIKKKFDVDPYLKRVWVKGELSNVKIHTSGHIYFTLKDEHARILAVMFSSAAKNLPFKPESGMNVFVEADVSVYEQTGQYQLYVHAMEPDGKGALYVAYEQLKQKLEQEGLFASARKRPIPTYPEKVGLITSKTGAAVQDMMTTLKRRYPIAEVILFPALVQGTQAPASIVEAIRKANEDQSLDVLLVGRGGGSIEELWAFNEEMVARAIVESTIPVISAVGHETDFTIADFVADLRAPTPTAAAELAVPNILDVVATLETKTQQIRSAMKNLVENQKTKLKGIQSKPVFTRPDLMLRYPTERLSRAEQALQQIPIRILENKKMKMEHLASRIANQHPLNRVEKYQKNLSYLDQQLKYGMKKHITQSTHSFSTVLTKLEGLNPLAIMNRGYSVTYKEESKLIKSIKQVEEKDSIQVRMVDGTLYCTVNGKEENPHD